MPFKNLYEVWNVFFMLCNWWICVNFSCSPFNWQKLLHYTQSLNVLINWILMFSLSKTAESIACIFYTLCNWWICGYNLKFVQMNFRIHLWMCVVSEIEEVWGDRPPLGSKRALAVHHGVVHDIPTELL